MSPIPPRVDLGVRPTPIIDAAALRKGLWIKDDGTSAPGYGGNKPRKLEFLLHGAGHRVATMGARGSHHALATAMHASTLGHEVHVVAFPRPRNDRVEAIFNATRARATIHMARNQVDACAVLASLGEQGMSTFPAGGSSPTGAQGFVRAGRELVAQIQAGLLPQPRRIHVAMGTAGTVVGLAIALREAALETTVMAVRVVPESWLSSDDVEQLARDTAALGGLEPCLPHIIDEQLGAGYGEPTPAAEHAVAAAAGIVELESTYTGKAMASALADDEDGTLLFWQTHNAHPIESESNQGGSGAIEY